MITLNPEQQEAFELVKAGKSICLTGKAGSGKSTIINHIIKNLSKDESIEDPENRRKISVTAMTGIAGTYINGVTLHSWAGIPVRQMSKAQILKTLLSSTDNASVTATKAKDSSTSETSSKKSNDKEEDLLSENEQVVKRWRETDLLIVDEVSMMSAEVFNKLDYLGRNIRDNDVPFGGLQLVLSGDFCQLPPIGNNERFCFESEIWPKAIAKTFILKQIMRQNDPALQDVLNDVREGKITMRAKELLNSRLISNLSVDERAKISDENNIKPTLIYPHRERVNEINRQKFEELLMKTNPSDNDNPVQIYTYSDTMSLKPSFRGKVRPDIPERELESFLDQHCAAERELHLCIGCQVMLIVNMNVEAGLVNGLTGIVTGFEEGVPLVTFNDGVNKRTIRVNTWTWSPDHPRYIIKRVQIPLILAWAITVHRSQGATLTCVRADLREAFGPGMAYVILSRIKSLSGLYLEGINYSKIKCDPRVTAFYKRKN
jgi:ATP-dependent DNA helicase PIF1